MQLPIFVIVAFVVLGIVSYLIARLMQIENAKILAGAYLLLSGLHIAVKRLPLMLPAEFLLATLAWLALAGGAALLSGPSRNKEVLKQKEADSIYFFLGTLSYAFALLLLRIPLTFSPNVTFSQLSPLIFLGVLPGIYYGHQLLTKADAPESCNARTGGTIISVFAHFLTLVALILGGFTPKAIFITSLLATAIYGYLAFINRKPFFVYTTIITLGIAYISGSCLLIAAVRGSAFNWLPLNLAQTTAVLVPLGLLYWAYGYFLKRKEILEMALPVHWTGVLLAGLLTLGSLQQMAIARYVLLCYAVVLPILALLWKQRFFTYWACGTLVGGAICFLYQLGVRPLGHYSLLIAFVASAYLLLGYFMTRRTDDGRWKSLYGTPLLNSSLVLNPIATGVVAIGTLMPATGWASLITSLLCGAVVTVNFICYTPLYQRALSVYLGCATFLGTILGAVYKLGFAMPVFPLALASVGMFDFILGFRICKKSEKETTRQLYGLPLVHSAIAVSGPAIMLACIKVNSIQSIIAISMMAAIYLIMALDKKQIVWSYLGIAVSSLGCYALTSALLPVEDGWTMALSCGLLSIGLAYFWAILGVLIHRQREEMAFFTEPCKWTGIALTAGGFVTFAAFMLNVGGEATLFQVSLGALGLALGTIFYLWLAWMVKVEVFVYVAEIVSSITVVFVRLTVPQWFSIYFVRQFWPVILVGISFAAFGLSYALQRLRLTIYVRPSYYMSIFLTLIPLVGTWLVGVETSVETLVGTGIFYSMLASIRRQRRYGYIAAMLFNLALQVFWLWQGLRFGVHPQLFITPIGLTLIGIAHLNRREFSSTAIRSLRSFAAAIIYAASTTELYTAKGWAPIILAALCLLGILSGMALRIRPFLYLGTAFLLLDIFLQIYRAGQTNSWIWWISGISFGLALLVLFAWFERKREQVLNLLDSLKEWD